MIPVGGSSGSFYSRQAALPERAVSDIQRTRREEEQDAQGDARLRAADPVKEQNAQPTVARVKRINPFEDAQSSRFDKYSVRDDLNPRERRALDSYFSVQSNTVNPPGQGELVGLDLFV